jgi:AcrR family transcriptional regulator
MSDVAPNAALAPRTMPRQRRAIERRRAILDATLALLDESGVDALTTSLIATRAGVPVASVYGYFPNKMAIIAELMRESMEDVDSRLEGLLPAAPDPGGVAATIDRAIDTILASYRARPARQRLFAAARGAAALYPVVRASDARMTTSVAAALHSVRPDWPAVRTRAVAQTVVQTFTALQDGVLACADPALFEALVAEWRFLVKAYLAQVEEA